MKNNIHPCFIGYGSIPFKLSDKINKIIEKNPCKQRDMTFGHSRLLIHPLQPGIAYLYPLKTIENLKIFWCFKGV